MRTCLRRGWDTAERLTVAILLILVLALGKLPMQALAEGVGQEAESDSIAQSVEELATNGTAESEQPAILDEDGSSDEHVAVATTWDFADALSGASLVGAQGSIIVLADPTGGYQAFDALVSKSELVNGFILGGSDVLSTASEAHFKTR